MRMRSHLFFACFIVSAALAAFAGNSTPGIISTIAGNGTPGSSGDGGLATSAQLDGIMGIAVDSAGNLYIADENTSTIRKVSPDGVISTAVGTSAGLRNPADVAIDAMGNLYIADFNNCRVLKVTPAGEIGTIATICFPTAVAVDPAGNVYVADSLIFSDGSGYIHKVAPNGTVSVACPAPGDPTGLAVDSAGNLYIAEFSGIWKVDPQGKVTEMPCRGATDVAVDSAGNLFIADSYHSVIYMVTPAGIISTVAGNGTIGFSGDGGPATSAQLNVPMSVAIDNLGNVLIGDTRNYRIRKVTWAAGSETFSPEGAWFCTAKLPGVPVPVPYMDIYTSNSNGSEASGTVLCTLSVGKFASPMGIVSMTQAGHGNWIRIGKNKFAFTAWRIIIDADGHPVGTAKFWGTLTATAHDETSGTMNAEYYGPTGDRFLSVTGGITTGKRIEVEVEDQK